VRLLLDAAIHIETYVPVDISAQMLVQEAALLATRLSGPYGVAGAADLPAVPIAKAHCRHGTRRVLSRLDNRQFRAASGEGISAKCRQNIGTWLDFGGRRRLVKDAHISQRGLR